MDSNTLQEKSVIVFRKNGSREHWTVAIVNEDRVYYPNETGAETDEVVHIVNTTKGDIEFGIRPCGTCSNNRPYEIWVW